MFKPYEQYYIDNFEFVGVTIWFQHGDWVKLKPDHRDKTCFVLSSSMKLSLYCPIQNCLRRKGLNYLNELYAVGKEIETDVRNAYGHLRGWVNENTEIMRFRVEKKWTA